jgi:hypothetical protein
MRIVASVLISLAVAFGLYVFYLKRHAEPAARWPRGKAPEWPVEEQMRKRLGLLSALFLVAGVTLAQQARQHD